MHLRLEIFENIFDSYKVKAILTKRKVFGDLTVQNYDWEMEREKVRLRSDLETGESPETHQNHEHATQHTDKQSSLLEGHLHLPTAATQGVKKHIKAKLGGRDDRNKVTAELSFFQYGELMVIRGTLLPAETLTKGLSISTPTALTGSGSGTGSEGAEAAERLWSDKWNRSLTVSPLVIIGRDCSSLIPLAGSYMSKKLRMSPDVVRSYVVRSYVVRSYARPAFHE